MLRRALPHLEEPRASGLILQDPLASEGARQPGEEGLGFDHEREDIPLYATLKLWQSAGDELFFKAMQHYTRTYRERVVETEDLRRAVFDATGVNLARFFQVTAIFLLVFVVQLFIYGFHELTEANVFPYSEPLHWATEPYGPDGRYGQHLTWLLVLLPLTWLAFASWRTPHPARAETSP